MSISKEVLTLVSKAAQKQVSEHEELLASGLIDSISAMDLMLSIQEKFNVEIPFEQVVNIFANTSNIIEFVERNYKG